VPVGLVLLAAAVALAPLVSGMAWPLDILTGATLGLGWLALCLLGGEIAQRLLDPATPQRRGVAWVRARWDAVCGWCDRNLWGKSWPLWALLAFGVLLRLWAPWRWAVGPDADRYAAMGLALDRTG